MESVRCWRALGVARWIRPQSDERTRRRQRVLAHRIPMCQPAGQKRSVKLRDAAAKILPYESDRPKLVVWLRDAAAKIPAFENERSKRHGNGARTLPYAKQHGCGAKRIYKTSENGKRRESARIGRQTPMQRELVRRLQNASGEDHIRSLVQSSGPPKTFQVRSTGFLAFQPWHRRGLFFLSWLRLKGRGWLPAGTMVQTLRLKTPPAKVLLLKWALQRAGPTNP
ncbi:uncharacterized protein LOC119173526 isoform X2 [Rhipicephalus microplus]|uniref:uncharacterized protein LOC119173526 isoform X2 n=1 Tax=Rhipicephalus microplus TaxID=6941 RepID=UPI003F6A6C0A